MMLLPGALLPQLLPMMPIVLSLAVNIFLLILLSLLSLQLLHTAVTVVEDGCEDGGGGDRSCGDGVTEAVVMDAVVVDIIFLLRC